MTLSGALTLVPNAAQQTPLEPFRLREDDPTGEVGAKEGFLLDAQVAGQWRPLYWFDLAPAEFAAFEMASWYLCHHRRRGPSEV